MRRLLLPIVLLATACGAGSDHSDSVWEWRNVLSRKKDAGSPQAGAREKQIYADSVAAFVQKHPTHGRAREVYQHIQLDFARELASMGRHQDAIRFYRAVLTNEPSNAAALSGIRSSVEQLAVSRVRLLALEKGMSQRDVANVLGKPIPGWTARNQRRDALIEAWYYRKSEGGIAGVYFRDGKLFAAEENSQAKIAALGY
jgi:hypothetical protein